MKYSHVFLGYLLTHWGRVTHICVSKLTIIGSDNGLSPGRRQAIIWTNAGILVRPLGTIFNEIIIEIYSFLFKKMHLKMSSGKWLPFCLGINMLRDQTCHLLSAVFLLQHFAVGCQSMINTVRAMFLGNIKSPIFFSTPRWDRAFAFSFMMKTFIPPWGRLDLVTAIPLLVKDIFILNRSPEPRLLSCHRPKPVFQKKWPWTWNFQ